MPVPGPPEGHRNRYDTKEYSLERDNDTRHPSIPSLGPATSTRSSGSFGGSARLAAIAAVTTHQPAIAPLNFSETPTQELFAANVFSKQVMKERLPTPIYKSLLKNHRIR